MADLPAYCPHCGTIFYAKNLIGGSARGVTLRGNTTNCPNCGKEAKIADGHFDFIGGTVELLSGPDITKAVIAQLRDIAERARDRAITPQQAIAEANAINPKLGTILEKYVTFGLPILLMVIGIYLQVEGNSSAHMDSKEIFAAIERLTEVTESKTEAPAKEQKGYLQQPSETPSNGNPAAKAPSTRRTDVNRARRDKIKERRLQFPRLK